MTTLRFLLVAAAVTAVAGGAQAAYMFDWSTAQYNADATGDVNNPTQITQMDITGIWWGRDLNYQYFRMDLVNVPDATYGGDIYGIYVDSGPGGGTGFFLPTELSDIDYVLDAHWDQSSDFDPVHRHDWTGALFTSSDWSSNFQHSENGGKTLEWRIPVADLPITFTYWGGVVDTGYGGKTWDLAGGFETPEPTTMALLGLGLGGLYLKRRRSRK